MHMSNSFFLSLCILEIITFHAQAVIYHPITESTNPAGFQTADDHRHHVQQQSHMTYETQANHGHYHQNEGIPQYNHPYSVNSLPHMHMQSLQSQNHAQQAQMSPPSGMNGLSANNHMHYQTEASPNQFSREHYAFQGARSTIHMDQGNSVRLSQPRRHQPYDPEFLEKSYRTEIVVAQHQLQDLNRQTQVPHVGDEFMFHDQRMTHHQVNKVHAYSSKNVYVNRISNQLMFNGIRDVIDHFHHFGCDINDEQPMKFIPNQGGKYGKMMILFENEQQASQFIQCIRTIQEKFDVDQRKVLLAQFARTNMQVGSRNHSKSLTGVYCDINKNCNEVESMLKNGIVTCGKKIKFAAPCLPHEHRFKYKA